MSREGRFSEEHVDFFDNPAWDVVRAKAQEKAMALREQGWSGAAMLPYAELEYSGFRDTISGVVGRFHMRNGKGQPKMMAKGKTTASSG